MGEWLNPSDCKSDARKGYAGSNPAPSMYIKLKACTKLNFIRVSPHSSVVERVLGKNEVGSSILLVGSSILIV